MYIQKVEDDSMGQVAKAAIVDRNSLPGVDHLRFFLSIFDLFEDLEVSVKFHLDIIKLGFLHGLEMRYFGAHSCKVMLDCVFGRPANVLAG